MTSEQKPAGEGPGTHGRDPGTGGEDTRNLLTRRTLVRAGWTLPIIMYVRLPEMAFAQYAHGDVPGEEPVYQDFPHTDGDVPPEEPVYQDAHGDHSDDGTGPVEYQDEPLCPEGQTHFDYWENPDLPEDEVVVPDDQHYDLHTDHCDGPVT